MRAREAQDMYVTMKNEYSKRRLMLGIDRLDYSKGIPHRVRAFRELLAHYPENRRSATLIQIASPTRETVDAYADIRARTRGLAADQRRLRRARLDAGALHPPHAGAQAAARAVPRRARRRWSRRCATA
jgi:hypothetical protein